VSYVILVPFAGDGAGVGELTWGQLAIWRSMWATGMSLSLGGVQPLPPGVTVDDAVAALVFMMERHQSLRTRLELGPDGSARQSVSASGEVPLEVVDVPDDADPAAAAAAVSDRYLGQNFDYCHEWPVRTAVIRHRGRATHSVAAYSHLAVDAHGLYALMADLLTAGPLANPDGPAAPVTAPQPLEQAQRQRTPAARQQSQASLRYWESILRSIEPQRFGESTDRREPRYWELRYTSPAAHLGALSIAARNRVGTGPVLLAAFAIALARVTGINPVVVQTAISNRFRPGLADSVSPLTLSSLCVLDVADCTFDEVVAQAGRASLRAARNAYYDPVACDELIAQVGRERGVPIDVDCHFNDRRRPAEQPRVRTAAPDAAASPDAAAPDAAPGATASDPTAPHSANPTPADLAAARPLSFLRWEKKLERYDHELCFHINDAPGTVDFTLCADTHCLSPGDAERVAHEFEETLVAAALSPDAATGVQEYMV
jgi:Condensation domain